MNRLDEIEKEIKKTDLNSVEKYTFALSLGDIKWLTSKLRECHDKISSVLVDLVQEEEDYPWIEETISELQSILKSLQGEGCLTVNQP